jgi:hypothetical protein
VSARTETLAARTSFSFVSPPSVPYKYRKALELDSSMKLKSELEAFLEAYDDTADMTDVGYGDTPKGEL